MREFCVLGRCACVGRGCAAAIRRRRRESQTFLSRAVFPLEQISRLAGRLSHKSVSKLWLPGLRPRTIRAKLEPVWVGIIIQGDQIPSSSASTTTRLLQCASGRPGEEERECVCVREGWRRKGGSGIRRAMKSTTGEVGRGVEQNSPITEGGLRERERVGGAVVWRCKRVQGYERTEHRALKSELN